MVRISIPNLPPSAGPRILSGLSVAPVPEAAAALGAFLDAGRGRTLTITGAGVSVDSGIRAYRGKEGAYSNPNYKPIFYGELVEDSARGEMFRKRYWARSFLGYPPVRDALPNPTHMYIASLQALGIAPALITQNVDNLHRKALALLEARLRTPTGDAPPPGHAAPLGPRPILELHGTLARVHCLRGGHEQTRDAFQAALGAENPAWEAAAREMEETGNKPRTNPDGDVELPGADYTTFRVPECAVCSGQRKHNSIVKPNVVFFGETLPEGVKDASFHLVEQASQLLVVGTSLATYSAFRLIKAAREQGKSVLMISQGPSRADAVDGVEKMERKAGPVLRAYLDEVVKTRTGAEVDAVRALLDAGVTRRPPDVEDSREHVQYPP
ncbi:hypothetical protein Q8F55_001764 [Vanrija albida]|uniref:Deacetylase sirtuin-type domain-containing protein n=1 Tax=Vanrija albida TaxID=181172 RepID=A0ABR3Q8R2_9TREE